MPRSVAWKIQSLSYWEKHKALFGSRRILRQQLLTDHPGVLCVGLKHPDKNSYGTRPLAYRFRYLISIFETLFSHQLE
jgi:hypothetical protein